MYGINFLILLTCLNVKEVKKYLHKHFQPSPLASSFVPKIMP